MDSVVKSRKTASTSTSPTKGVQKFYTKIRHKIEDIPPKISAKLNKCNVVAPKISPDIQKPTAPPRAARRNRLQSVKKSTEMEKTPPIQGTLSANYENIKISSNPNGLQDSDEECRMSMNDSTISLEDEIFEELEKVAHDEAKLKAVLKNFDKILAEFNERNTSNSTPTLKITSYSSPSSPSQEIGTLEEKSTSKDVQKSEKEGGHKPLQKSKTCSIIESRCILKKSVSDPTESKTGHMSLDDFPHFKAFQVTKSLWNLKDFEEFAKTGKKMEKFECKLPILKTNYNTYKVDKNSTNPEGAQTSLEPPKANLSSQKLILPKAKSVWELSPSQNSPSHNSPCIRTYSGSKIPVMKTPPQKLGTTGRSNSFCDQISPNKQVAPQAKTIQVGKVLPTPKRPSPAKNTTVTKIVHNLNEMSASTSSKLGPSSSPKQPLVRATSSLTVSSNNLGRYPPLNNLTPARRRSAMSSASSTPHSLHKIGISVKAASIPSSVVAASITGSSKMKSANSEMSLTSLKPPRGTPSTKSSCNKTKSQDVLLNKCLQKGHELLRKVEAFGSVTKLPESRKVWPQHDQIRKGPTVKISPSRRDKPKDLDYNLVVEKKISSISVRPSEDVIDCPLKNRSSPKIVYATESVIHFPRLESCKIIPPILGNPSQQTAELLVNVKAMQQPLRVHQDSMLCVNSDVLRSEKEYHSDCSDDSGHISNENDEMLSSAISAASTTTTTSSICLGRNQKGTKISELLEKFEPVAATGREAPFSSAPVPTSPINGTEECGIGSAPKKLCTTVKVAEVRPVKCITSSMEICPMFSSEVLFRSGVLSQLEAKRDELLSDRIVQLQAYCRGYLARRRVAQRRVQELAVRCIQRNVKAFLAVRDWPWWRLLVRVTPLLNVHRTEEQLKIANDELQTLRAKLEKIENDRNALKTENDKLEAKLSEITVDLAEERSTSNMATERLEAETAERLKLEKELQEQQGKVKNLQETSEKLEMELICAKSDLNGISEDEDPDNEDTGGVYKLKYERVARELEFTKRRLQSQHEHDLEQLVGLKKQLEKKLADAYEEVEEQRQVVGQWKRKTQKMTNEMNDLRMLLEEQNGRNNLLEKKQRKFDSECQALQDAARQERQAKERLAREKDVLIAEKFTLEQNLADTRLELDLKEEKLAALQRDMAEMTFGGGTEEEVAQLRRSKLELDRRLKEQEEELDEMAGQVQLLEQAKLRLEMTLETMRKEARKEAQQRDDELEEARGSAYKKIKALECQLETEHEERTLLLREKHELERRLQAMEEQDRADRSAEEAVNQKLRRDLRKYKALLKDAHAQLERLKADSPGKALIRQLRNQLEDAEAARSIAIKARQSAETELSEIQVLLEEAQRSRTEAEEKATASQRDRAELQAQIEENEEEMSELMKKFSQTVKQLNNEQTAISEAEIRISELETERNSLKEQIAELQTRLENVENMSDPSVAVQSKRLELRAKELESRLELEQATRARLEVQANRHKDALEKVQNEVGHAKMRELQSQETLKKTQKNLRELREEFHVMSNREQESITRRKDLEKKLETAEAEVASLRNDLRLALQRIADLQQAMEEGDDDVTESEESDSTDASLSDLEQRLRPIQVKRTSVTAVKDTNGLDDTTLVLREKKSDNSPRITVTSPSTANGDTSFA